MAILRVKWFSPLDRLFGPISEIELDKPVTVAEFLIRMRESDARLEQYLHFGPQDTRASGLMILRGDKSLNLTDNIEPGDKIDILVGIQGG